MLPRVSGTDTAMKRDPWYWSRWALHQKVGNSTRKLILNTLAVMAESTTGECFASRHDLAEAAECSERSVYNHVVALEDAKLIARVKRYGEGGRLADGFRLLDEVPATVAGTGSGNLNGSEPATHVAGELPSKNTPTPTARPREVLDLEQLQASERRVLEVLRVVASEKAADLNERRVLQILKDFPDRDHVAEVEKFEHWHLQGKGQNVQRRNLTTAWRNWLDSASPVEERPRMSSFNGWKRPSARPTLEQETAERLYPGNPDAVFVLRGALSRGRATDDEIRAWVRKWRPDIEDGAA